jgi:hypothetical protein
MTAHIARCLHDIATPSHEQMTRRSDAKAALIAGVCLTAADTFAADFY